MKSSYAPTLLLLVVLVVSSYFLSTSSKVLPNRSFLANLHSVEVEGGELPQYTLQVECGEEDICPSVDLFRELPLNTTPLSKIKRVIGQLPKFKMMPVEGKEQSLGFSESARQITLRSEGERSFSLRLGKINQVLGGYYAQPVGFPDQFIVLPKDFVELLYGPVTNLLQNELYPDGLSKAQKIVFTGADDESLTFESSGEDWLLNGKRADQQFVKGLLSSFKELRFTRIFQDSSSLPSEAKLLSDFGILIQDSTNPQRLETLSIYEGSEGALFAKKGAYSYLFRLGELPRIMRNIRAEQFYGDPRENGA